MSDRFVIVAEYMDSIRADLARQVLEDFGIQAIVVGGNAGDGRIGVFETVKLQVRESDAARAKEILESEEFSYNPEESEDEEFEEFNEPDEPEEL